MQPLSVQEAGINFKESRSLILPSQGLLTMTNNSHKISVLPPTNDHPQSKPVAQGWGIKFLNLPPVTSHSESDHPTTQIVPASNPEAQPRPKYTEDKTRCSTMKRPLSLISLPSTTQFRIEKPERRREQEFPLLPPVTPAYTPAPEPGLRLLRCTSGPQGNITFPQIAPAPSSRPCTLISAPLRESPMLKLLHIESGAKMARNIKLLFKMSLYI